MSRDLGNWELEDENTIYFWGGVLSNWYKSEFKTKLTQTASHPTKFNCSEQHMMAVKSLLFEDYEAFVNVMTTTSPSDQKAFGRQIVGYTDVKWDAVARDYSFNGIFDKFYQNWKLADLLINTGDKLIVEASPYDRKWGVGFSHLDAPEVRDRWGKNWLGQILMEVREDLRAGRDTKFTMHDWSKYERTNITDNLV